MNLKCQHCGREWDYTGRQEYQTTCPNCGYKVSLRGVKNDRTNRDLDGADGSRSSGKD